MPKDTFFNLPDEKREFIEEIAIDEFAEYGYDKASISRIVKNASIAKGSFYQYFKDKKDLFKHIMKRSVEKKLEYMSPILMNPTEHDFFTLVKEMYISGLRFGAENKKLLMIGNQVLKNKDHPIYKEAIGDNMQNAYKVFENLLNMAIERGEVKRGIDTKFISYIISTMNVSTVEYYFEVVKNGDEKNMKWEDDIMETVDLFIDFIRNGVGVRKRRLTL